MGRTNERIEGNPEQSAVDLSAEALQMGNLRRIHQGLAHDLRAPFNAAYLQIELLKLLAARGAGTGTEKQASRLDHLELELKHLQEVLEALTSQFEAHDTASQFDLAEVVREVEVVCGPQAGHRSVELDFVAEDATTLRVTARRDRLRSAVFGLVVLALDALDSPAHGARIELRTQVEGSAAILRVSAPSGQPTDAERERAVRSVLETEGGTLASGRSETRRIEWCLSIPRVC